MINYADDSLEEYLSTVGSFKVPTGAELAVIVARAQAGDKAARNEVLIVTIPWVVRVARGRAYTHLHRMLPLPDRVQEGIMGVIHDSPEYIDRARAHEEIVRRYRNAGWVVSIEEFRDDGDEDGSLFWDMVIELP